MSTGTFFVLVAITLFSLGLVRVALAADHLARLVALNVMGAGTLLVLVVLAARSAPIDPVLSALAITGLVITVAFTGVGLVLAERIETARAQEDARHPEPGAGEPE